MTKAVTTLRVQAKSHKSIKETKQLDGVLQKIENLSKFTVLNLQSYISIFQESLLTNTYERLVSKQKQTITRSTF